MTPEELTQFVVEGDREGLCRALAPLDEMQRGQLAEAAAKLFDRVDNGWGPSVGEDEIKAQQKDPETAKLAKAMSKVKYADWRVPRLTAGLAVLGLCGKKELEAYRGSWFRGDLRDMPQRVLQILSDRRPPWLAAFVQRESLPTTDTRGAGMITWPVERGLIRGGALPPCDSDDYIRRMAEDLPSFAAHGSQFEITTDRLPTMCGSLREVLLADPELLKHEVWRLFEVETRAFAWQGSPWFEALRELCDSKHLDRRRLLEASARAMTLPFRQGALSGYAKFHESLQPTQDERAELTPAYLAQLASDLPLVASQALDSLEGLAKAKRLKASEFLAACPLVFRLEKKAPASKALKVIKLLVKQNAACAVEAAHATSAALQHTSPDVQEQALDLLEALGDKLPAELRGELAAASDHLAAALRPRLEKLAGSSTPEKRAAKPAREKGAASAGGGLQARADALPQSLSDAAGVAAALQAIAAKTDPWPSPIDPRHVPRRDPAQAVAPVASLDELIDVVAAFVERADDAMEVERILDGIHRFHAHKPDDWEKRTAALRKRIEAKSERFSGSVLDVARYVGVAQLIRAWLELPELPEESTSWWFQWTRFFSDRCDQVRYRVEANRRSDREKRELPLLALPTHQGGWLDPVVLVERMRVYQGSKRGDWGLYDVGDLDFAQALLRLTIDGSGEALVAAKMLAEHRHVARLRFALGDGDAPPGSVGGLHGDVLQLATAHARAALDPSGPTGLACPLPRVSLREDGGVDAAGPVSDDLAFPPDLLIRAHSWHTAVPQQEAWGNTANNMDWLMDWRSLVWPFDRRPLLLWGLLERRVSAAVLKNLLDPGMSWGDEAARLAAWALGTESPAAKVLITDALIEGFRDCRIDPRILGRHLAAIAADLKLNRVADVLAEAARVSPLHHWSVFRVLDTALGNLPTPPRDLHHWLTPLLESATVVGQTLSDEARTMLQPIKGSSKTAKLAAQLLGLKSDPARMHAVRELALGACLDRAERWQSLSAPP